MYSGTMSDLITHNLQNILSATQQQSGPSMTQSMCDEQSMDRQALTRYMGVPLSFHPNDNNFNFTALNPSDIDMSQTPLQHQYRYQQSVQLRPLFQSTTGAHNNNMMPSDQRTNSNGVSSSVNASQVYGEAMPSSASFNSYFTSGLTSNVGVGSCLGVGFGIGGMSPQSVSTQPNLQAPSLSPSSFNELNMNNNNNPLCNLPPQIFSANIIGNLDNTNPNNNNVNNSNNNLSTGQVTSGASNSTSLITKPSVNATATAVPSSINNITCNQPLTSNFVVNTNQQLTAESILNSFPHNGYKLGRKVKPKVFRPFKCNQCDKAYKHKCNLITHRRIHNADAPTCSFCSKKFTNRKDLARHERTHTGIKPFVCKTCGKPFNDESNLSKHMGLHTGNKRYVCKSCGKKFCYGSSLKRHVMLNPPCQTPDPSEFIEYGFPLSFKPESMFHQQGF